MMEKKTTTIVGTAVLGTLVLILDYTLKFSGLKIPFPWFPQLKLDFTGIPIVLSFLMFDLSSGAMTSSIAFFVILLRSGNLIAASQKALAEFFTIFGLIILTKKNNKLDKAMAIVLGLFFRVVVMSLFNLAILPIFYSEYYSTLLAAILFLPMLGVFNIIAGSISLFGGIALYEALERRAPSLIRTKINQEKRE